MTFLAAIIPAIQCFLISSSFQQPHVELQEFRETRGYVEAVLACFDTTTTWNLHVCEKLRRDLPDVSTRVKVFGAPDAYEVDWWSLEPGEDWEPVDRGEFDDVEAPSEVSHLA